MKQQEQKNSANVRQQYADPYSFGQAIRAARLGYHWCSRVRAMMRLSGAGPWRVELCPPSFVGGNPKGEHLVWWPETATQEQYAKTALIVDSIQPLRHIKAVKRPISFLIGERGELLVGGAA